MAKVLIQFAHPALEKSRIHKALLQQLKGNSAVSFNDLYERYPNFDVDVDYEQSLLLRHDIIVLQHPFYWYSAPAMVKQWLDLVLEHGWAYGRAGTALQGKVFVQCVSCGGTLQAYSHEGRNQKKVTEFLLPFAQTAALCGMQYLDPFIVYGTHKLTDAAIAAYARQYAEWLVNLQETELSKGAVLTP